MSGGKFVPAPLKDIYRAVEKMTLGGQDPLNQATVLDIVRGLIEFDGMDKMTKALNYFMACDGRFPEGQPGGDYFAPASTLPRVMLHRMKDRMARPTAGGWADALFSFSFVDDENVHVCEVQLAHQRLMTDRKEGGAHHNYNIYRAAFEILESIGVKVEEDAVNDATVVVRSHSEVLETVQKDLQDQLTTLMQQQKAMQESHQALQQSHDALQTSHLALQRQVHHEVKARVVLDRLDRTGSGRVSQQQLRNLLTRNVAPHGGLSQQQVDALFKRLATEDSSDGISIEAFLQQARHGVSQD
jgi:hypothetical protein